MKRVAESVNKWRVLVRPLVQVRWSTRLVRIIGVYEPFTHGVTDQIKR